MEIETARLLLRSFRCDDLGELLSLAGDWQVARWLSTMPHPYTDEKVGDIELTKPTRHGARHMHLSSASRSGCSHDKRDDVAIALRDARRPSEVRFLSFFAARDKI